MNSFFCGYRLDSLSGTPKADLIAITEAVPVGKHNMYKLRFAGRKEITGWVPQFVVLQYWSKQKLDAWNSTRVVNRYEMPVIGYGSRSCDATPVIRH